MRIYWSGEAKNIIGPQIRALRLQRGMTQRALAARLQLAGYEFSDLTILRIENGTRFVPDYLCCYICYTGKGPRITGLAGGK